MDSNHDKVIQSHWRPVDVGVRQMPANQMFVNFKDHGMKPVPPECKSKLSGDTKH